MISFSGIDCSGKSTQIDLLCKELENNRWQHVIDASDNIENVFSQVKLTVKELVDKNE